MRISDWSSDVCSSDLLVEAKVQRELRRARVVAVHRQPAIESRHGDDMVVPEARRGAGTIDIDDDLRRLRLQPIESTGKIGRASCRGRVCREGEISWVYVSSKKKKT